MDKRDLWSYKKYGEQERELTKLLRAVRNAKNYSAEVKAKTALSKYLKKTKLDE